MRNEKINNKLKELGLFDQVMQGIEQEETGILDEYRNELNQCQTELEIKKQCLKQAQGEIETLLKQVKSDNALLEKKENDIENLKREVNKTKKDLKMAQDFTKPGAFNTKKQQNKSENSTKHSSHFSEGWLSQNLEQQV